MSNPTGLSPSTIATGLQLWLDANDPSANGTLPTNNTVITTWFDKSGAGNNITGFNSPRWYASPSRMSNASSAYFSGANPTSYNMTAFFVYFDANVQSCAPVYTSADPLNTGTTGIFPNCGGTTYVEINGPNWATQTATITKTTSNILSLQYSSASNTNNVFVYFNGTLNFTTSSSSFTRTSFTLGRRVNEILTGNYYEALFYNTILSTTERQQVEGYLAWKWGLVSNLPAAHPYRNNPFISVFSPLVTIPTNTYLIPVNTFSTIKTFTLPVASTNAGRMIIFKDYLGYANTNPIYLSTIGLDRIERSNVSSMILSNAYGAWTFANDGITEWFLLDGYFNNLLTVGPTPPGLSLPPAVRYSFLSGNYSGTSPVLNIGSNSAVGAATVVASSYTSASPGFITTGNNTNHYVQAPSQSGIQTIIMIIRVTNAGGNTYLLDARDGLANGWMWNGGTGPDWLGQTYYRDCVLTTVPNNIPGSLQDSQWHHVCFIRAAFTDNVTYLARLSLNESIGADTAEIMAFSQALTLQQVKDNFNFFASRFGWAPVA